MISEEDKPPVFRNWSGWYWLVTGFLVLQIIVYYILTVTLQ